MTTSCAPWVSCAGSGGPSVRRTQPCSRCRHKKALYLKAGPHLLLHNEAEVLFGKEEVGPLPKPLQRGNEAVEHLDTPLGDRCL